MIYNQEDMPFTEEGVCPLLLSIQNPSRMTIGQLMNVLQQNQVQSPVDLQMQHHLNHLNAKKLKMFLRITDMINMAMKSYITHVQVNS